MKTIKGYKFITNEMKSKNGSETAWEIGKWKKYEGQIELCRTGYHASRKPTDVFEYIYMVTDYL